MNASRSSEADERGSRRGLERASRSPTLFVRTSFASLTTRCTAASLVPRQRISSLAASASACASRTLCFLFTFPPASSKGTRPSQLALSEHLRRCISPHAYSSPPASPRSRARASPIPRGTDASRSSPSVRSTFSRMRPPVADTIYVISRRHVPRLARPLHQRWAPSVARDRLEGRSGLVGHLYRQGRLCVSFSLCTAALLHSAR